MRGGGFPRGHRGYRPRGPREPPSASATSLRTNPSHSVPAAIDREKVCPLLLRVFPKTGSHYEPEEFEDDPARAPPTGVEPKDEVQMYTWQDATLRELCELVKEVFGAARRPSARLSFALIYPDSRGRKVLRQIGVVHSTRTGQDDTVALRDVKFETGDFLSVAVY
jgi:histone deacetylase complex subunit SAP18